MIPSRSRGKKGAEGVAGGGNWTSVVINAIDRFTRVTGRALAWCALAMALLTTTVVILRYGFSKGSIAMQESVTYLHGSLFMLGVAYALQAGAHVRVDIFYRGFTDRQRAWVDALGGILFLLPLCGVILVTSWGYVLDAWSIRESSPEPGGIPFLYVLKTLIPVMAINLAVAGIAEILRNAQLLVSERSA